jgi:hypothetical protein
VEGGEEGGTGLKGCELKDRRKEAGGEMRKVHGERGRGSRDGEQGGGGGGHLDSEKWMTGAGKAS